MRISSKEFREFLIPLMADTLAPLTAAAASTATIMYPVDVIRAIRMTSAGGESFSVASFIRTHGLKGMATQGATAEIVKSSVMRVSKFFFFPIACQQLWGAGSNDLTPIQKGISGALATVPEILLISPMECAKLGLQTDFEKTHKNSMTNIMRHIHQTRGWRGLWSGWTGMQLRNGLWTGFYFATLASFKEVIEPTVCGAGMPLGVAQFMAGFSAGTFAALFNTPADVVRSVVQRRMFAEPHRPAYGISPRGAAEHVDVLVDLIHRKGIRGIYPGFGFKAMHLGGSGALMAFFIPIFARMMGIHYDI